jgi:ribosome modulation factor
MKKQKNRESKAFQAGIDDYTQGVPRFKCPYPPDASQARGWLAGWDEAARLMREQEDGKKRRGI